MKIIYAGTPQTAIPPLEYLTAHPGIDVVAVLTRQDAPVGRKKVLTASPVARRGEELGLPVIKTSRWDERTAAAVAATGACAAAVVAYGALLPPEALTLLPNGWVNLHFSALPAWRGAAPVQRALQAGETVIHAVTFLIEEGLDTGPVFETTSTRVSESDTATSILERLGYAGGPMLARTLEGIAAGQQGTPQTGEASYAKKMTVADGRLNFTDPTDKVVDTWRGATTEPGAWCELAGTRIKIGALRPGEPPQPLASGQVLVHGKKVYAGTADGAVQLLSVQPAGKKMMDALAWARGANGASEGNAVLT